MKNINIYIFTVYILSVFVDLYNGYVQQINMSTTVVPIIFKGTVIMFSLKYLLKYRVISFFLFVFTTLCVVSLMFWLINGYQVDFLPLLVIFSKLIYPYMILVFLLANKYSVNPTTLLNYLAYYGVIASFSILLTDVLGLGVNTYGENYGFGTKGLFKAGNDLSLCLILCNCIVSYLLSVTNKIKYIFFSILITLGSLKIGSTAVIIGTILNVFFLLVQSFIVRATYSKQYQIYKFIVILLGIPLLVFFISSIITIDLYTIEKFNMSNILAGNARHVLKEAFYSLYNEFSFSDILFGVGPIELEGQLGKLLGLHGARSLEIDHLELLGSYGFFLGSFLFIIPVIFCINYFVCFLNRKSLFSYWMTIATCLFIFHGVFAGHAYSSVQAMVLVVGIFFLSYYKNEFI